MTLGLGIICRNSEYEIVDRALSSVKSGVDEIYITVADKDIPSEKMSFLAEKYKATLTFFKWENRYEHPDFDMDFAAARNFNMSQCKEDWYTWIDADDEVEGMEKAKPFLEKLSKHIKYVICTYNYAFFPSGKVDNAHPKERFMRMSEGFEWKGALHENCITDHRVDGVKCEDIVWNHRSDDKRSTDSCFRNIRIVEREIEKQITDAKEDKEKKVDPRTVFNLGMAYSSYAQKTDEAKDWEQSVQAFQKYVEMSGWDTHAYMAFRFMGNAYMKLERPMLALTSFFECLKIAPQYRDGYASLGAAYLSLNDKERAKHWFKLALIAGEDNGYVMDNRTALVMPLISLAEIYATEGKLDDAEKFLRFAIEETKIDDEGVTGMLDFILETKAFLAKTKEERTRLEALPAEKQREVFEQLDPKTKSSPELIAFRRSCGWKKDANGHELVIHTGTGWEEWSPDSVKTGIGGSEEAVINMAQELTTLGWDVTVYGNHGFEAKEYDGVWYRPYWEWSPVEPTDVFISWRDPTLLDIEIETKKRFLWLHDTNPESSLTQFRLDRVDKIFVLSKYHRSLYPNVPNDKFIISANGIKPEHFEKNVKRNPKKCMYVSAPNRGLLTLLQLWPKIREQVPDAELFWAYGWDTYDIMAKTNPSARRLKEDCLKLLCQPGVTDLGRIGHENLATHMMESGVWLYPTAFTEIYCISAIKAQASGMVPVTTNVAALDETVQYGTKIDSSDIYTDEAAQEKFVDAAVLALTTDYPYRDEMMHWAKDNWPWSKVANGWDAEFRK